MAAINPAPFTTDDSRRADGFADVLAGLHTSYRPARQFFMAAIVEHAQSHFGSLSQGARTLTIDRKSASYMLRAGKAAKAKLNGPQIEALLKMSWIVFADVNTYSEAGKRFSRLIAEAAVRLVPMRAAYIGGAPLPNKTAAAKLINVHRNHLAKMLATREAA